MISVPELPTDFKVEIIPPKKVSSQQLNAIAQLRAQSWQHVEVTRPNEPSSTNDWLEPLDHDSHLWLVSWQQQPVATARVTLHPDISKISDTVFFQAENEHYSVPVASFKRLVVLPEYRKQGLGKFLMLSRLEKACELGAASVMLICPDTRTQHLVELGFEVLSGPKKGILYSEINWTLMRYCF